MLRIPRGLGQLGGDREWRAVGWLRIVESEVVDQLLGAHRIDGRKPARIQQAADVGVRRRVCIDGEGRQRLLGHALKGVLAVGRIALGVGARHDAVTGAVP